MTERDISLNRSKRYYLCGAEQQEPFNQLFMQNEQERPKEFYHTLMVMDKEKPEIAVVKWIWH